MGDGFTCLIPFYNEGDKVLSVVGAASKVSLINQIVCIDGGSTDNTSALISKKYPKVDLVTLKEKGGKAEDVDRGLEKATNENILLLDGDLRDVNSSEIENQLGIFIQNPSVDMIILRQRGGNNLLDRIQRKEIIFSGNRIMHRSDLREIMKLKPRGYRLEVVANKYMMDNSKKVFWIKSSIWNLHKIKKWGFLEGMRRSFSMEMDLFLFLGPIEYFRQVFFFCLEEIKLN